MTNKIALGLALAILALFVVDQYAFGGILPVFLGKKIVILTEYLAFWR